MNPKRMLSVALAVTFVAAPSISLAQTPPPPPQQGQTAKPTPPPAPQAPPKYEETVVVSASKTEQKIVDAPATMSVFTPQMLETTPAANYSDLLRTVPGVNVTQLSARDINITSRAATSSLSTSQLAVLDGRSIYQDFFGFVMWDFMPANMDEVKQIEVIRGPASAVWGANALTGVVNVITKTPREMRGASVTFGGGAFSKNVKDNQTGVANNADPGQVFFLNGTLADVINDEWSYKMSAGYYQTDAFARPLGKLPSGTAYPTFSDDGTKQPKFDLRFDRDFAEGARLTFAGGTAGTSGIMETGIGPFKIKSGTMLSYGKVNYTNKGFHAQAFMNMLDGEAPNLLSVDAGGNPVQFTFNTKTFDFEMGDTRALNTHNVVTYGGNLRFNKFDLSLAPSETSRTEGGVYVQDEIFVNNYVRFVLGARVDKFSSISDPVFSPRAALVLKPANDQTFRVSYNRAFRAPSMINNALDVTIANPLPLAAVNQALQANRLPALFSNSASFLVPTRATGNANLKEEFIDAYEVSYTGKWGPKTLFTAAWYLTKMSDEIFFTVKENYSLTVPPAGWTSMSGWSALGPAGPVVATQVWGGIQNVAKFPKEYTYLNLGKVDNQGIELGLITEVGKTNYSINYSYQSEPKPDFPGFTAQAALSEINLPSKHRFNVSQSAKIFGLFYSLDVSVASQAFWQDVLDSRFNGTTPTYTLANMLIGKKFNQDKVTFQVRVNNLANRAIQQHIFGDVLKRSVMFELKINAPKK